MTTVRRCQFCSKEFVQGVQDGRRVRRYCSVACSRLARRAPWNRGDVFGKLTVVGLHDIHTKDVRLMCRCECGTMVPVRAHSLRDGTTKSCGCARFARVTKHGLSKSALYANWNSMRERCENRRNSRWDAYGGRGITVCERWQSFENFLADMGPKPSARHSIDRIDVNGHYEPGNCRWATAVEQGRNTRRNVMLSFGGRVMCVAEWAEATGLDYQLIYHRILLGWEPEDALTAPPRGKRRLPLRNGAAETQR